MSVNSMDMPIVNSKELLDAVQTGRAIAGHEIRERETSLFRAIGKLSQAKADNLRGAV
ncbi:hypothetical protein [Symmachiella dynata]|uniref:hypothetical protein n=1 Tax=Symmachiella dynata TaxID=2527995 RepID=UPI0018D4CD3F|nr:hypothetical protein [Symmachiella dynata]